MYLKFAGKEPFPECEYFSTYLTPTKAESGNPKMPDMTELFILKN